MFGLWLLSDSAEAAPAASAPAPVFKEVSFDETMPGVLIGRKTVTLKNSGAHIGGTYYKAQDGTADRLSALGPRLYKTSKPSVYIGDGKLYVPSAYQPLIGDAPTAKLFSSGFTLTDELVKEINANIDRMNGTLKKGRIPYVTKDTPLVAINFPSGANAAGKVIDAKSATILQTLDEGK